MTPEDIIRILEACHLNGLDVSNVNIGDIHIDQRKMAFEHNAKENVGKQSPHWQYAEEVTTESKEVVKTLSKEERIKKAYDVLKAEGFIERPGDMAFVKKAMEGEPIKLTFTPEDFLKYMGGLGIQNLPDKSTIYRQLSKIGMKDSDGIYEFNDNCGRNESMRRNNLMKRFHSAFNRATE